MGKKLLIILAVILTISLIWLSYDYYCNSGNRICLTESKEYYECVKIVTEECEKGNCRIINTEENINSYCCEQLGELYFNGVCLIYKR